MGRSQPQPEAEQGFERGSGRRPSLYDNSVKALAAQIIMAGAKFGTYLLVARRLGPVGQGTFALAVAVTAVVGTVSTLGTDTAGAFYSGRERERVQEVVGNTAVVGLLGWVVLGTVGGGLIVLSDGAVFGLGTPLLLLIVVITLAHYTFLLLVGLLTGTKSFGAILSVFSIRYVSTLALVILLGDRLTVVGALGAWMTGVVLANIVGIGTLWHGTWGRLGFDRALLARQLRFGVQSHMEKVSGLLTYRLDLFLVGAFTGWQGAGLYSVAQQVAEMFLILPRGAAQALLAEKAGERSDERTSPHLIYLGAVGIVGLAVTVVGVLAPTVISVLFSAEFVPAVPALRILLVGVLAMTVGILTVNQLIGMGLPRTAAIAGGVSLLITVVLDLALIPVLGIVGAAIASVVAYAGYTAIAVVSLWRHGRPDHA